MKFSYMGVCVEVSPAELKEINGDVVAAVRELVGGIVERMEGLMVGGNDHRVGAVSLHDILKKDAD